MLLVGAGLSAFRLVHCQHICMIGVRQTFTAGAYGSTKRYKSFERLYKVNDCTVLGAGGELSDYQYIKRLLEELADDDFCMDDGHHMKPHEIYSYLTRVIYNRRNK